MLQLFLNVENYCSDCNFGDTYREVYVEMIEYRKKKIEFKIFDALWHKCKAGKLNSWT